MTSLIEEGDDLSLLQEATCCDSNALVYFGYLTLVSFVVVALTLLVFKKLRLQGWKLGVEFLLLSFCLFGGLYYYGNYYGVESVEPAVESPEVVEQAVSVEEDVREETDIPMLPVEQKANVLNFSNLAVGQTLGDFKVLSFEPLYGDEIGEWNARVNFSGHEVRIKGEYDYSAEGDYPHAAEICVRVTDASILEQLPLRSDGEREANFCLENSAEAAAALGLEKGSIGTVTFVIDTYQINWAEGAYLDSAHFISN